MATREAMVEYRRIIIKDELGKTKEVYERPFWGTLTMKHFQGRTVIIKETFWNEPEEYWPSHNHSIEAHRLVS